MKFSSYGVPLAAALLLSACATYQSTREVTDGSNHFRVMTGAHPEGLRFAEVTKLNREWRGALAGGVKVWPRRMEKMLALARADYALACPGRRVKETHPPHYEMVVDGADYSGEAEGGGMPGHGGIGYEPGKAARVPVSMAVFFLCEGDVWWR